MIGTKSLAVAAATALVMSTGAAANAADRERVIPDTPRGAKAVNDTHVESKTVLVAPCRIADTRLAGGKLANNGVRTLDATGTLSGQGGESGCNIPDGADAIQATITAVSDGGGFVKAFAAGAPEPATAFMNTASSAVLAVGGNVPLGDGDNDGQFTLKNFGPSTHLVIDVTGYVIKPMFAVVNGFEGVTIRGSRVVSMTRVEDVDTGAVFYEVIFDRNVAACAALVTPQSLDRVGSAFISGSSVFLQFDVIDEADPNVTFDVDADFQLEVTC